MRGLLLHRWVLGWLALALLPACAVTQPDGGVVSPRPDAQHSQPNIVLIMADDLGWSDVSIYGAGSTPTPNIDRIGEEGAAFTSGYVTSPACAPSRAGLMSGRYPQKFGFEYNMFPQDGTKGMPREQSIMPEMLKEAGYRTALIGKWHQGVQEHQYPTNRGFDYFFGFLSGTSTFITPGSPGIVEARPEQAPETTPRDADAAIYTGPGKVLVDNEDKYLSHEITREAVSFIEDAGGEPYFLYIAHHAPHRPFQVPQRYYDMFEGEPNHDRRVYQGMVAAMDEGIGEVLDAIARREDADNTIVVFLSDNGCPSRFGVCDCSAPTGAGKYTHLEGGIRVPFLISWPAGLGRVGTVHEPMIATDLFATFAAAAGIELDQGQSDGMDIVAALQNDRAALANRTLYWRQSPVLAVRQGQRKLLMSPTGEQGFDLDEAGERETAPRTSDMQLKGRLEQWDRRLPEALWEAYFQRQTKVCEASTYAVY